MPKFYPFIWLRMAVALLLILFGNAVVSAQPCNIQTDDPSPVCQGTVVTYTVMDLPPLATQVVWVTPGGTQIGNGTSISVRWDYAVSTTVTANLYDNIGNVLESCILDPVVVEESPVPMIVPMAAPSCPRPGGGDKGSFYCQNTELTFNANGNGGSYEWAVTGNAVLNTPATGNQIGLTTGASGSFTVILTETSSADCVGQTQQTYLIAEPPVISITEIWNGSNEEIGICKGQTLHFQANAEMAPFGVSEYVWQVFVGNTVVTSGSGSDFIYTFPDNLVYVVKLTGYNCAGCFDEDYVTVRVSADLVPNIICPSVVCDNGLPVQYCTDSGCGSFEWTVNGGTIESGQGTACIQVLWNDPPPSGIGTVTLDPDQCKSGCSSPVTIEVPILHAGTPIEGPTSTCDPHASLSYELPNWQGAVYTWSVENVMATNGGSVTTNSSNSHLYGVYLQNFTGSFTVHVVMNHPIAGCEFEYNLAVVAGNYGIVADPFYCRGEDVTLSLQGDLPAGAVAIWSMEGQPWTDTGDEVTIPADAFPGSGYFNVRVTIALPGGVVLECSHETIEILAEPAPVTNILGPENICLNQPYTYTAIPEGDITWTIVGGTPSSATGNPVSVTWTASTGPYQLTVTRREEHMSGTTTKTCESAPFTRSNFIPIQPPVTLTIKASEKPCPDQTRTYKANYDGATSYQWLINPALGSIVSGQGTNMIEVYWNVPLTGTNTAHVILNATVCGQDLTTDLIVSLVEGPVPVIDGDAAICEGAGATFTATVTGATNNTTYTWEMEMNGVVTTYTTTENFVNVPAEDLHPGAGVLRVTATKLSGCGGSQSDAFNFVVVENPSPGINTPDLPLCIDGDPAVCTITLYAQNYSGADAIYTWTHENTVGTGNPYAVNINPFQDPSDYGTYMLEVMRTYDDYPNLVCTATDTYEIQKPDCGKAPKVPDVFFEKWDLPECGVVEVWGNVPGVPAGQWDAYISSAFWVVEDFSGTVIPAQVPINGPDDLHTTLSVFSQPGYYSVWLQVQFIGFPASSLSRRIVEIPVAPNFNWAVKCGTTPGTYDATFTDMSELIPPNPPQSGTSINAWLWKVGDDTGFDQNFSHTFVAGSTEQTYEVCLTVTSTTTVPEYNPGIDYACTICKQITIPALPNVSITPVSDNVCEGTPIQFQANYDPNEILDLSWNFGDNTGSYADNPIKTYNDVTGNQTFEVEATFTDNYGCIIKEISTIQVNDNTLVDYQIVEMYGDCNSMAVLTLPGAPAGVSYEWGPGGEATPSIDVYDNGVYSLTITDPATGCSYTPPSEAVLVESPFPAGLSGERRICRGTDIRLTAVAVPGYNYNWISSIGLSGNDHTVNISTENLSEEMITITMTASQNGHDCATEVVTVHIDPTPAAPHLDYTFTCPPYPVTVSASDGAGMPLNVSWTSGGNYLGFGPQIIRFSGGGLSATLTNEFGCSISKPIGLPRIPVIDMLTGCYPLCDTALNAGLFTLPAPTVSNGPIVDWQWYHNDTPLNPPAGPWPPNGPATGTVLPLPLTEDLAGAIFLRVHKRFQSSNGDFVICEFDSDFFCLEVEDCSDPEPCTPPEPTVRTVVCIEGSEKGDGDYYVHWDYLTDGIVEPCMYEQDLTIHNAAGDPIGHFTAIDHESLSGLYWHFEGQFHINPGASWADACWDIPFCRISTGELCGTTTACMGNIDLSPCEDTTCRVNNFEFRKSQVNCENDPTTGPTHLVDLVLQFTGIPFPECNAYDIEINTVTGTMDPVYILIDAEGDNNGNLILTSANEPALLFDWYDQIGIDMVCFQVVLRYDAGCLPKGTEQKICTQRFCIDASDLDCSPEREGTGPYNLTSTCRGYTDRGYVYLFEIELLNERNIAGYSLIPGQSSGNAVLTSVTDNVIRGIYYSPTPQPIFREGITIVRPDRTTANYIIEGVMPYCGEGDGKGDDKGDGKKGGPRSILSESKAVQMTVVPNPASDQVQVQFQLPADLAPNQNAVVIHNSLGAEVLRQPLDETTSGGVTLQLNDLPGGWYQVSLWNNTSRIATQKLVLIKR